MAEKTFIESFRITKGVANHEPSDFYPSIIDSEDKVFVSFADASRRQKVAEYNKSGDTINEYYVDSNSDWLCKDDNHHRSVIGIDKDGYLHLVADMHNYPNNSSYDAYLPTRYQNKVILYWKSDNPNDASSWTFMGDSISTSMDGRAWGNWRFATDNNGVLYFISRVRVHSGINAEGITAVGIYKYSESTATWSALGAIPAEFTNSYGTFTPDKKAVIWADGGSSEGSNNFYQGFYDAKLYFDSQNRMHLAVVIASEGIVTPAYDTVLYAMSDDGGTTWKKADGTVLSLPVTPHAGASQGDLIVSGGSVKNNTARVAIDDSDNPIVFYRLNSGDTYFRSWNGSAWSSPAISVRNIDPPSYAVRLGSNIGKIILINGSSTQSRFILTEDLVTSDEDVAISDVTMRSANIYNFRNRGRLFYVDLNYDVGATEYVYGYTYYNYPFAIVEADKIVSGISVTLDGSKSTANDNTISTYGWTQESGPNTANIVSSSSAQTEVNNLVVGAYVFRLTITDNEAVQDYDEITLTVSTEMKRGIRSMLMA